MVADAIRFVGVENNTVSNEMEDHISGFELFPSYPNPFNPSTNIEFNIPKAGHVSVNVYSINGQLISTLFEGRQSAGRHQLRWNAQSAASGVYLLKMDFTSAGTTEHQIQKLTLIK